MLNQIKRAALLQRTALARQQAHAFATANEDPKPKKRGRPKKVDVEAAATEKKAPSEGLESGEYLAEEGDMFLMERVGTIHAKRTGRNFEELLEVEVTRETRIDAHDRMQ